jgi:lipopolysaccharide/colanic/teichoic acid biosynthesis glycosyltransferase
MYATCKRVFDLSAALVGLVLLAPLLAAIAVAIRLDSPGPILYLGERVGLHGKTLRICKFRTMCVGAERLGTTTADNDPRITRVGRFLRKYKLDELPQLFNVVKGEMSLVGPRPEVEEHTREYSDQEKLILTVLPGITDYSSIRFVNLGKVLGSENAHQVFLTRYRAEKNRLRLEYVRKRSFREDMRILFLTFVSLARVALGRSGEKDWSTQGSGGRI